MIPIVFLWSDDAATIFLQLGLVWLLFEGSVYFEIHKNLYPKWWACRAWNQGCSDIPSFLSWCHSCEKRYQALSRFSILQTMEIWAGSGNEANPRVHGSFSLIEKCRSTYLVRVLSLKNQRTWRTCWGELEEYLCGYPHTLISKLTL